MQNPIFTFDGGYHLLRWIHFLAGVTWIGILYYFNFVQGAFFAETDAQTKATAIRQLVPKALWWFRWGAAFTWISGILMLGLEGHRSGFGIYSTSWGIWIISGAVLGTIMAANVWFIIWPAQKVVIASANAVASGVAANPSAAALGARGGVASRTNVLFSIPLLFMMGAARHLALMVGPASNLALLVVILGVIFAALELNAIFGKTGPMTTVKGVIHCGLALTVVLYIIVCVVV